jgi:hypothetical protein
LSDWKLTQDHEALLQAGQRTLLETPLWQLHLVLRWRSAIAEGVEEHQLVEAMAGDGVPPEVILRFLRRWQAQLPATFDDEVQTVHALWQQILGYPDRSLTPARRKVIASRLKEGFTLEQFRTVFTYARQSDFLRGKYDDVTSLLRSRERMEQNLGRAGTPERKSGAQALQAVAVRKADRQWNGQQWVTL